MTTLDLAFLILRIGVGLTFAAHGAQKAFGWWGGPGPAGWSGAMVKMGFTPAGLFAALSTGLELIGGLFLAAGLLTPLVAAALVAQSIVIVARVHWANGFFSTRGGIEFPLALGVVCAAICLAGPGELSVDAAGGFGITGGVRVIVLLLGIAAGLITQEIPRLSREEPAPETPARRESQLRRG
jgi:putative oxidoreductase